MFEDLTFSFRDKVDELDEFDLEVTPEITEDENGVEKLTGNLEINIVHYNMSGIITDVGVAILPRTEVLNLREKIDLYLLATSLTDDDMDGRLI